MSDARRTLALGIWSLVALCGVVGATGTAAARADLAAATRSRAVVVVDLGNGDVRIERIEFSGELSGLGALERAGFTPVTRSFGSLGAAVCALTIDGEIRGCPADSTCLLCDNPRYWSYSRDTDASGRFTASRAGPSTTTIGDGDVEAWRWGTGDPPAYVSFESQFPSTTTAPQPTTVAPTSGAPVTAASTPSATTVAPTSTGGTSPGADGAGVSETTPAVTGSSGTSTQSSGSSTSIVGAGDDEGASAGSTSMPSPGASGGDRATADGPPVVGGGSSSASGFVAFLAVVAALLGALVVVRRRRAGPTA